MYAYDILRRTLFSAALLTVLSVGSRAQQVWHFEEPSLQVKTAGQRQISLRLTTHLKGPELVKGFKGNGLRTDGYSTWLSARLDPAGKPVHGLQAEFALETYPTDTAGFFAVSHGGNWVSACVDRFGMPMLGVRQSGKVGYYGANMVLPKFKWFNIGLNLSGTKAELLVNGRVLTSVALDAQWNRNGADSLLVGRDWRSKAIGPFPVTAINGIVDELVVSPKEMNWDVAALSGQRDRRKAVLAVSQTRFAGDFTRPRYHLLPAANWTNETHAFLFDKGRYHIFNQKNGANLFLGQINWGHFSSPDLVSWTEHEPVLSPEPGYDQDGIWSGCIVRDDAGQPIIFYSAGGNRGMNVSSAYPRDASLDRWQKYAGNPVIAANPAEFTRKDFHDPIVWKEGSTWYMGVGFGLMENGQGKGTILLYQSADLKKWDYLHPLFTGNPNEDDSGVFWEMPLFWKLNGKYILLVNKVPERGKPAVALYWTGDFLDQKFVPDSPMPKRLEVINRLLSPSLTLDAEGRTTAIAIIPDETSARETYNRGWTHLYSIPRVWTLEDGKIRQSPHPALTKLRAAPVILNARRVDSTAAVRLSEGRQQLELNLDIVPGSARRFGFVVGKNADGKEQTRIYFDLDRQLLIVDQTRSSKRKYVPLQTRTGNYAVKAGATLHLRLFIDGSVIEGFINNEDAFTTRLFPLSPESTGVELFAEGGEIQLQQATVWPLKSSHNQTGF